MGLPTRTKLTDRIIRPSNLGKWSACARKTYANIVAPVVGRGISHIRQWVGDSAHAVLAGDQPPDADYYMLYDTITPDIYVAKMQVKEIVSTTRKLIGALGFVAARWEVPVATDDVEGTLDVLLRDEALTTKSKFTIGDLKTGQRIPAGTWLQLGQYYEAYDSMPDTNLGDSILLLHVPRTPLNEQLVPHTEFRDGPQCAAVAREWAKTIAGWVDAGSLETMLPSPGYECSTCQLTVDECHVKIERIKS